MNNTGNAVTVHIECMGVMDVPKESGGVTRKSRGGDVDAIVTGLPDGSSNVHCRRFNNGMCGTNTYPTPCPYFNRIEG